MVGAAESADERVVGAAEQTPVDQSPVNGVTETEQQDSVTDGAPLAGAPAAAAQEVNSSNETEKQK